MQNANAYDPGSHSAGYGNTRSALSPKPGFSKDKNQDSLFVYEDVADKNVEYFEQQADGTSSKAPRRQSACARTPLQKRDPNVRDVNPESGVLSNKSWQKNKSVHDALLESVAAENSLAHTGGAVQEPPFTLMRADENDADHHTCPTTAQKTVSWNVEELSHHTPNQRMPLDLSKFTPLPMPTGDLSGMSSDDSNDGDNQYTRFTSQTSPTAFVNEEAASTRVACGRDACEDFDKFDMTDSGTFSTEDFTDYGAATAAVRQDEQCKTSNHVTDRIPCQAGSTQFHQQSDESVTSLPKSLRAWQHRPDQTAQISTSIAETPVVVNTNKTGLLKHISHGSFEGDCAAAPYQDLKFDAALCELTPTTIRQRSTKLDTSSPYEVDDTITEHDHAPPRTFETESELGLSDKENIFPETSAEDSPQWRSATSSPMLHVGNRSSVVLREREVHHSVEFSNSEAGSEDEADEMETASQSIVTALSFETCLNPMTRMTAPPLTFQRRRRRRQQTTKEIVIHGTVGCTTTVTMSFKNSRERAFRVLACVTAAAQDEACFSLNAPQLLLQPDTEDALELSFSPNRQGAFDGTLVLCKDNQVFQFKLLADAALPIEYSTSSPQQENHQAASDVTCDTQRSDTTSRSSTFSDVSLELRHEWLKQWVEQRKHQINGTQDTTAQFSVVPLSLTLQATTNSSSGSMHYNGDILIRNFGSDELDVNAVTSSTLIHIATRNYVAGPHDDFRLRVSYDGQPQQVQDPIIGYVGIRTQFGSRSVEIRLPSAPPRHENPADISRQSEHRQQSREEPASARPAEASGMAALSPPATRDRVVYFRRRLLDFGHIQAGALVEKKIDLCNRLYEPVVVYVSDPKLPFILTHNEIHIRPRSYVRVPVRFLPVERKEFAVNMMAQTADGKSLFWVELKGVAH